jgi:hypothetical protein
MPSTPLIKAADYRKQATKTKPPVKAKASNLTGFVQSELDRLMDAISIHGKQLQDFGPVMVNFGAETEEGENKIVIRLEKIKLEIVLTVRQI